MIAAAIGCLSFASLGYELLITRFFSIAQWSHLSFLAVGLAMFGYAAGGTVHGLSADRLSRWMSRSPASPLALLSAATSLAITGSYVAVKAVPLEYLKLPVEPLQALYLLLSWAVLSLPFLAAGCATSVAYAATPERSGRIAAASLLGSAVGALAPALLLPAFGEGGSAVALALAPLLPMAVAAHGWKVRLPLLGLCAGIAGLLLWDPDVLSVRPSSYKTLPLLLQDPGSAVVARQSGIRGLLEEVHSPSLRFSPGLSLAYEGSLPRQVGLVVDGDSLIVLYEVWGHTGGAGPGGTAGPGGSAEMSDVPGPDAVSFARWTHSFAAFELAAPVVGASGSSGDGAEPIDCLVLQQDGGLAVACALAASVRSVTVVSEDPRIAQREEEWYRGSPVSLVADNPRSFLARRGPFYSTVVIEDWGPSIPGMASLQVDSLLTVDSLRACWRRLRARGVLAVSRRLILPPSDSLRLFAAMLLALRKEGVESPSDHLAVLRSWDSCTLMASRSPLDEEASGKLRAFAQLRSFDVDYLPGLGLGEANRFSRYDRPVFAEAYARIIDGGGTPNGNALDVGPQGDDRPFPSHVVRWTRVREFFRATGERTYTLLLTGEIVAGLAFLQALLLSILVLSVTFLVRRGNGSDGGPLLYGMVGLTGIGFTATELSAINSLTVLFTSPTVALAISLGGLLTFSALGGLLSERIHLRALGPWVLCAAVGLAAAALLLPAATAALLPLAFAARAGAAIGLSGIPGFLIGVPFPAAMRLLPKGARDRARAWAVNGCASVMASMGSALLAPAFGIHFLLLVAAVTYGVAGLALTGRKPSRAPRAG